MENIDTQGYDEVGIREFNMYQDEETLDPTIHQNEPNPNPTISSWGTSRNTEDETRNMLVLNMRHPTSNIPVTTVINMEILENRQLSFFRLNNTYLAAQELQLARTGFYFDNTNTNLPKGCVTCFACNMTLGHWVDTDVPKDEHRKFMPSCPHLTKTSPEKAKQQTYTNLTCPVCWDKIKINVIVLPCAHTLCFICAIRVTICPICRKQIRYKSKIFN